MSSSFHNPRKSTIRQATDDSAQNLIKSPWCKSVTHTINTIKKSHKLHDNCFYNLHHKDTLILFKKPRSVNKSATTYLHNVFCLLIDMTDVRKWLCAVPAYQLINMLKDTWWIHWYEAWQWQLLQVQLCYLAFMLPKLQIICMLLTYKTQLNVAKQSRICVLYMAGSSSVFLLGLILLCVCNLQFPL